MCNYRVSREIVPGGTHDIMFEQILIQQVFIELTLISRFIYIYSCWYVYYHIVIGYNY